MHWCLHVFSRARRRSFRNDQIAAYHAGDSVEQKLDGIRRDALVSFAGPIANVLFAQKSSAFNIGADVVRQSGWEHSDNQDGHFGGRGGGMIVAARR